MSVKINFDAAGHPETPTLILAKKNGDKLGKINAKDIEGSDAFNDAEEFSFVVHKYVDGVKDYLWEQIADFKLVYCVEWDSWFEMKVEYNESAEKVKTVTCKQLGQSELSQIMIYNIEINTGDDIARNDYDKDFPTLLYRDVDGADEDLKEKYRTSSLLHRIMEKAPHYKVIHVDESIMNEQREFSFDGISIYDAFKKIAEEINCIFVFNELPKGHVKGDVPRTISVYDLESNCNVCGHRDDFFYKCSKCGSENITLGYGEDTAIFVTSDELAETIQLTTDTDSVKNCFRLEAGDELMTTYVVACNPNGSSYIWHFSDDMKSEMSQELQDKIAEYDEEYGYYQNENKVVVDAETYNNLFHGDNPKYPASKVGKIESPLVGYPALMEAYFNTIDADLYLRSGLLPSVELYKTNAKQEAEYLKEQLKTTNVSVSSLKGLGATAADNAVEAYAEVLVDPRYKAEIVEEKDVVRYNESSHKWNGSFVITSVAYDEDDEEMTEDTIGMYKYTIDVEVVIDENYESFVKQKVEKHLAKNDVDDLSIAKLFEKELDEFKETLKQYGLNSLSAFEKACEGCINVMIQDKSTWADESDLNDFLGSYNDRQAAIRNEMLVREADLDVIGDMQDVIEAEKAKIQSSLDFESFLGEQLMLEFSCFRREDKYSNENYISDGLDTSKLFENAYRFLEVATKEIKKSSELQHSISTTLKNLLVIPKFKPLVSKFKVGNWLRIMIDDVVYRFRLIKFTIDYNDLENIQVDISDISDVNSSIKSVMDIIAQASSMATSYSSVKRQAKQGEESKTTMDTWANEGLDATLVNIVNGAEHQSQTWNDNGMLFREYDPITETYSPEQMKIINATLAVTDDDWKTIRTAVGKFSYIDKNDGNKVKTGYGINAEAIIGKLLMGEGIVLENEAGTLSFNENGLYCEGTNQKPYPHNTVIINPNESNVLTVTKTIHRYWDEVTKQYVYLNEPYTEGVFFLDGNGDVVANSIYIGAKSLDISEAVANHIAYGNRGGRSYLGGMAEWSVVDSSGNMTTKGRSALAEEVRSTPVTENSNISFSDMFAGIDENVTGLSRVAYTGETSDLLNFKETLQDNEKSGLASVAFSGDASSLTGLQSFALGTSIGQMPESGKTAFNDAVAQTEIMNKKIDNPKNHYTATEGSVLMKTEDGSRWVELSELKSMLDALV